MNTSWKGNLLSVRRVGDSTVEVEIERFWSFSKPKKHRLTYRDGNWFWESGILLVFAPQAVWVSMGNALKTEISQ